jgi:4,5-dihydroxyphthalate decarboxylase
MSFSWYVTARGQGEPVIALPIFLLRMPVLGFVYVRSDSPYTRPADLVGKRIGSRGYRQTVNLWLRGVLKEHYGLAPEDVTWVTAEEVEGAGYTLPARIRQEIRKDSSTLENLKTGVVDAMFCTSTPQPFVEGEPWIRRLFPDAQAESHAHARLIGGAPITHVLVMNKNRAERQPWIAASLTKAFTEAQREADALCILNPKRLSLPDSFFIFEQQRAAYGNAPYAQGLEPNRKILEAFIRYAFEQGYIPRPMKVEEFFLPVPAF